MNEIRTITRNPKKLIAIVLLGASLSMFCLLPASSCSSAENRKHKADEHITLGLIYLYEGNFEDAINECSTAYEICPHDRDCLYSIAQCEQYAGRFDLAAKYIERAVGIAVTDEEKAHAYSTLGYYYFMADQPNEALDAYKQALRYSPQSVADARGASLSLARLNRLEDAFGYATMFDANPSDTRRHLYWGQIYGAARLYQKAVYEYQKALKAEPDLSEAQIGYGKALEGLKSFHDAELVYLELIKRDTLKSSAYVRLASLHFDIGQYVKAKDDLDKAIELSDKPMNNGEISILRARILRALNGRSSKK